ncbi:MAG: hypothetical protein GY795_03435 [Desulfobacterales bacterium]|nr:hypothetical protein [Desulfobacterales bacterium]
MTILKRRIGKDCIGVFPSDRLPKTCNNHTGFIANTDPAHKPGTHWIAIFVNQDGKAEYFDSFGLKPWVPSISKFLKQYKECCYSKKRLQDSLSSVCGHYCLYFLINRWMNVPMEEILQKFTENYERNDDLITDWVNETFDMHTDTFDFEFLVNQICIALNKTVK